MMRSTVTTAVHYSRHARRTHRDHGPLDEVLRAQVPHRGQFKAQKSNHDKVNFASVFIGAQKALAAIPSCTGRHRHWSLNSVRDTSHPTVNDRPNTPIQCGSAARARSAVWQQPPCEGSPGRARLSPGYSVYVVGLLGLSGRGPLPFRGVCPTPPVRAFFSLPWAHEHEKQRQSGLAGQPSGAPALPVARPQAPQKQIARPHHATTDSGHTRSADQGLALMKSSLASRRNGMSGASRQAVMTRSALLSCAEHVARTELQNRPKEP